MEPTIEVLRLSGRGYRDLRITTHCALVTRAFGGKKIYLSHETGNKIQETLSKVRERFGGTFDVEYVKNPLKIIDAARKEGGGIIHLTMYGEMLSETLPKIRKKKWEKILIVIGADKVPPEIYTRADFNISVTNQPHSEVAALAVTMHELMEGNEEKLPFKDAKLKILPSARGKKIQNTTRH